MSHTVQCPNDTHPPTSSSNNPSSGIQSKIDPLNPDEAKFSKASKLRSHFMRKLMTISVDVEIEQNKLSNLREDLVIYSQEQYKQAEKERKKKERKDKGKQNGRYYRSDSNLTTDVNELENMDVIDDDKALKTFMQMKKSIAEQERRIAKINKEMELVRLKQKEVFKTIWKGKGLQWGKPDED